MQPEYITTVEVDLYDIDIYGYFDSEEMKYDWYDLFARGECINEGDPLYEYPTQNQIEYYFSRWRDK